MDVPITDLALAIADGLARGEGHLIIDRGPHYVQMLFGEDGRALVEVVSDEFLEGEAQLRPGVAAWLDQHGWRGPTGVCELEFCGMDHPNFWRFLDPPVDCIGAVEMIDAAVRFVFHAPLGAFRMSADAG